MTKNFIDPVMNAYASMLNEALTDKQQREADQMAYTGRAWVMNDFIHKYGNMDFVNQHGGIDGNRIRIPASGLMAQQINPHPEVKAFLHNHGYFFDGEDYKNGLASKTTVVGNPEKGIPLKDKVVKTSIGKLLKLHGAPDRVNSAYENDPSRAAISNDEYEIHFAHRNEDIYGMSTGRGWTSCADMDKPKASRMHAAKSMPTYLNGQPISVAYLVKKGKDGKFDTDNNAVARVLLRHHKSIDGEHGTLVAENRVYGTAPDNFRDIVSNLTDKMFPKKDTVYVKNEGYNDSGNVFHVPNGAEVKPEHLDQTWKTLKKEDRRRLYEHVTPTADGEKRKYKTKALHDFSRALGDITAPATGDFVSDIQKKKSALYSLDDDQMSSTYKHDDKIRPAFDETFKNFDINNESHINEIAHIWHGSNHTLRSAVSASLRKKYGSTVSTPEEYSNALKMQDLTGHRDRITLDKDHKLGHDPIATLANAGVLTNGEHFRQAYYSAHEANQAHDNFYGAMHRMEEMGVKNAHHGINESLAAFSNLSSTRQVEALERCNHPGAIERYCAHVGIDSDKMKSDIAALKDV